MKIISVILLGLFLTACSEEVKTLEYYKTHHEERLKVIEECDNKGEPVSSGPNCRNAYNAQAQIRRANNKGPVFN